VLRGTRFVSPDGFLCGLADEPPAAEGVLTRPGLAELACTATDGTQHPAVALQVEQPAITVEGLEPGVPASVTRGSPQQLTFAVNAEQTLPELRVTAPEGVSITDVVRDGNRLVVTLVASPSAPANFDLGLEAIAPPAEAATTPATPTPPGPEGDPARDPSVPQPTRIAELSVNVEEPAPVVEPPPAPTEEPAPVTDARPQEAFGLSAHPSLMGLINDRRVGSGGFTVVSHQGRLAQDQGYWRTTMGIEAAPFLRLRLGMAHAIDVTETGVVPAARGDRDLQAWVGYRAVARRDLSVYVDLTAWFPTGGEREGITHVRLGPSLALSYLVGDRVLLRTRQGALLGVDSAGPFLWASAYGADVRLVDALYVGLEVDSSVGRLDGDLFTALGAGLGLSALAGPAAFSFGFRYGFTNDFEDSVGRFTLSAGLRISID
jgi:hypothetical protein